MSPSHSNLEGLAQPGGCEQHPTAGRIGSYCLSCVIIPTPPGVDVAEQLVRATPARTDRLTVDTITSDQLDALYERLARAEQEADESVAAAARLASLVGKRSERAERAAGGERLRANIAETELRTLRSGLRANGADPTQIQNLWAQIHLRNRQWREAKQRAEAASRVGTGFMVAAELAEAAVERVHALHVRNERSGHCEHCSECDYPDYAVPYPCPTVAALAEPKEH